jgi:hypothetical protein
MPTVEEQVHIVACDGCAREFIVRESDEWPPGFYGSAKMFTGDTDAPVARWFACKAAHIKQAVLTAISEGETSDEQDTAQP